MKSKKSATALNKELAQYKKIAEKELKQAKKKFALAEKKTKQFINKNPEQAAIIAAAMGAAAGAALGMVAGAGTAILRRKK